MFLVINPGSFDGSPDFYVFLWSQMYSYDDMIIRYVFIFYDIQTAAVLHSDSSTAVDAFRIAEGLALGMLNGLLRIQSA